MSKTLRASLAFVLALAITLLSSLVQREGPEQVAYSNMCGPAANEICYKPALKGGFPIAYVFDAPGVSVERQLAFGEDRVHPTMLVLNIGIYWAAFVLSLWLLGRVTALFKHSASRGEA